MRKIFKKMSGLGKDELEEDEVEEIYEKEDELADDDVLNEEEDDDELNEEWIGDEYEEGQLSIDVYQTPSKIVVKSTIAGVKPDNIDISINNDMLTIRGKRQMDNKIKEENYLYRECYWGSFSRSIILPVEVEQDKIDASLENGVLTISLPKAKVSKQISIKVKGK